MRDMLQRDSPQSKSNIYAEKNVESSMFRTLFLQGEIPCHRSFDRQNGENLIWKIAPQILDYSYYLPIFFDGLCEEKYPYSYIARNAIHDLLNAASDKIKLVIPQLIFPIKNALNTKNSEIIIATLRIIQHMCMCDPCIAVALIPYYRQLLPILNLFKNCNINTLDRIDYDRKGRLGDVIDETLEMLERCGGFKSYINIKYLIPTYESCVNNHC